VSADAAVFVFQAQAHHLKSDSGAPEKIVSLTGKFSSACKNIFAALIQGSAGFKQPPDVAGPLLQYCSGGFEIPLETAGIFGGRKPAAGFAQHSAFRRVIEDKAERVSVHSVRGF
jgi:hypothetical protein